MSLLDVGPVRLVVTDHPAALGHYLHEERVAATVELIKDWIATPTTAAPLS